MEEECLSLSVLFTDKIVQTSNALDCHLCFTGELACGTLIQRLESVWVFEDSVYVRTLPLFITWLKLTDQVLEKGLKKKDGTCFSSCGFSACACECVLIN